MAGGYTRPLQDAWSLPAAVHEPPPPQDSLAVSLGHLADTAYLSEPDAG